MSRAHEDRAEFLRSVPLFSGLHREDLDRLSELMQERRFAAGQELFREGEEGDWAYVIRQGSVEIVKTSRGKTVLLAERGAGELIGELALLEETRRMAGARAVSDCRALCLSKDQLNTLLASSPGAARAMLRTVITRLRDTELQVRQSEKLAQLGELTAGVAHELNNPASAVLRGAETLRESLSTLRRAWQTVGAMELGVEQIRELNEKLDTAVEAANRREFLRGLKQNAREEQLEAWLQDRRVEDLSDKIADLVDMDLQIADLESMESTFSVSKLGAALTLLSACYSVSRLLREIHQGAGQIASVVKALKSYSYLDQGPVQLVDIHESLENTLILLRGKIRPAVSVRRDYARELPRIQASGNELNQVWTNLVDNAVDAAGEHGEVRIRTGAEGDWIVVEIEDNGAGIPEEVRPRLFTPFFTTKAAGSGTGQGLRICQEIVHRHAGNIEFRSRPGETVFRVRLPVDFRRRRSS
jgi:signal transduction histidine kinase